MTQNSKQTTQRRNGTMGLEHIPLSSNIQSKKTQQNPKNIYIKTKQKEKIKKRKKKKKKKKKKKT
jgi:guanylate kinase